MAVVATARLDGHEARADATLRCVDEKIVVALTNLWIAPGAPDVRLYVSPRPDGVVDETAVDLGPVPDRRPAVTAQLPEGIDPAGLASVIVYCKVYSVLFGYGTLVPAG